MRTRSQFLRLVLRKQAENTASSIV
jgi:hypothetical protein